MNVAFQAAFSRSKLTIETLEQGVKYVNKLTIKMPERRQLLFIDCLQVLVVDWVLR